MTSVRVEVNCERGFSLIELMVAMTLGLILIAGAVSIYLATKRSYTEVEQGAGLAENSRFAIQVVNQSLRHAGFFGGAHPRDIELDASLGAVTGDCADEASFLNVANYLIAEEATSATVLTCVTDALPSDADVIREVLVVKHVLPTPLYDRDPDDASAAADGAISFPTEVNAQEMYVLANSERGLLFDGADGVQAVGPGDPYAFAAAWPYRLQVYYIRNLEIPTLSRLELSWDATAGAMGMSNEDLVQGVEAMRFRFGVDSSGNGEVNRFVNVSNMSLADWQSAESVEVSLLLRTAAEDPTYVDERTYVLAGAAVTPGGNWRRQLVQTNVSLRNPKLIIRGGL